jgi:hypothetical protein
LLEYVIFAQVEGEVLNTQLLCLTLKNDTTDKNEQKNERQNANASAKSKELHPNA